MTVNHTDFTQAMNQGHSAAWDQNWSKAVEHYRAALSITPDEPMALNCLGLALYELKELDESLRMYQRAAAITPEDPAPLEKMAQIYERLGQLQEAVISYMQSAELKLKNHELEKTIEQFNRALMLDPENLTARTRLAMIYDRMGRKADAIGEYLAAAALMQADGDNTKAIQVMQYSVQLDPNHTTARQALSMLKNGQPLPSPSRPKGGTGPMRMAQVRQMESASDISTPQERDPISEARILALKKMANVLFDQPDDAQASGRVARRGITALSRGTGSLSPEHAERARIQMHLSQAIDSQTSGDDEQTIVELQRAVELGLHQSPTYYILGLLLRKQEPEKALAHLQISVKNPDYALASNLLIAEIFQSAEQWSDAAVHYLKALQLADGETLPPDQAEELIQLYEPIIETQIQELPVEKQKELCPMIAGHILRQDWRKHLEEARLQLPPQPEGSPPLPLAEMLLVTSSSQVVEALARVRSLVAQKKIRSAMEEAFYALQYAPGYLPLHVQIGELLALDGQSQEAIEKFLLVASLYNLRNEVGQAIRLLQRVTKMAPMDLSVRSSLIEMLRSQGRVDEALQQYMDLANIYYQLVELDMARDAYQAALSLAQESSETRQWAIKILNKLADIELQSLDWKQAIQVFEQLRSLQPDAPAPRITLIDLHFRMGQVNAALMEADAYIQLMESAGQGQKATKFLLDLLKDHENQLELRKRLAVVYANQGLVGRAVEQLDTVANALLDAGDRSGAILTVKQIIQLNPPNKDEFQEVLKKLQSGA